MSSSQDLCRELVSACDGNVTANRIAAALVLLAATDDDLELDLDTAPASLRAVFADEA